MAVKTEGGATLATYLYDALGHRVQTVVGSANTEFVFNPAGQRVSTWNGATGAQIQGQYYWGGKPVALYTGGQTYFQHQDWEGTERLRTTYNGSTEGTFTSLPFGDGLGTASGSDNDAYHYGMLDHDYESDTEHAQFRQYSSAQGHWLSPDPYSGSYDFSNPQSLNRYVYALNNPLSNVDPNGLECVWDDGSYDSADDPDTGTASGCAALGGTYVDPGLFEGVEGTNFGDWSSNPNANIAFDWTTVSASVSAGLCPSTAVGITQGAVAMGILGPPAGGAQALSMLTGHVVTVGIDASAGVKFGTIGATAHTGYSLAFDPQGGIALISTTGGGADGGFDGQVGVTGQFGTMKNTSVLTLTDSVAEPTFNFAAGEGIKLGGSTDLEGNITTSVGFGEGIEDGFNLDSTSVRVLYCGQNQ